MIILFHLTNSHLLNQWTIQWPIDFEFLKTVNTACMTRNFDEVVFPAPPLYFIIFYWIRSKYVILTYQSV